MYLKPIPIFVLKVAQMLRKRDYTTQPILSIVILTRLIRALSENIFGYRGANWIIDCMKFNLFSQTSDIEIFAMYLFTNFLR